MDTTQVKEAKTEADLAFAEAAKMVAIAQAEYGRAMQRLIDEHGATAVARELGITRARVYQIAAKAKGHAD